MLTKFLRAAEKHLSKASELLDVFFFFFEGQTEMGILDDPCQDGIVIISNKSVSPYSWWCLEACSTMFADFYRFLLQGHER